MLPGVFTIKKTDGSTAYRASITYKHKHISLGTFHSEEAANLAYERAKYILESDTPFEESVSYSSVDDALPFEKVIILLNFRDNGLYSKSPIYLRTGFFNYYFSPTDYYTFSAEDLFYYSTHKINRRGGHLYVNDYGSQIGIYERYGIKPYAVKGRDYEFANADDHDLRYENIIIKSKYHGVRPEFVGDKLKYRAVLHINGNNKIGIYSTEIKAAIAYNKAVDSAKSNGFNKNFPVNYISEVSPREYAEIYSSVKISDKFTAR